MRSGKHLSALEELPLGYWTSEAGLRIHRTEDEIEINSSSGKVTFPAPHIDAPKKPQSKLFREFGSDILQRKLRKNSNVPNALRGSPMESSATCAVACSM